MLSKNNDCFYYDMQHDQWFRVLVRGGGNHIHEVSIPVTPKFFPGTPKSIWKEIKTVEVYNYDIREHPRRAHTFTNDLPEKVYNEIINSLDKELADFIIHADILPLIDWDLHADHNTESVPLKNCMVERDWFFKTLTYDNKGVVTEATISALLFVSSFGVGYPIDSILIGGVYQQFKDDHFRTYGFYDFVQGTVTFEVMMSGPEYDVVTRFSSRIDGSWADSFKKYMLGNQLVKQETIDTVSEMIDSAINNLAIYLKVKK